MFIICRTDDDTRHRDRYVKNKFFAIASKYGIVNYSLDVKAAIWRSFSDPVL